MSTNPNEPQSPEVPSDDQSPVSTSTGDKAVPPVPPAPPQSYSTMGPILPEEPETKQEKDQPHPYVPPTYQHQQPAYGAPVPPAPNYSGQPYQGAQQAYGQQPQQYQQAYPGYVQPHTPSIGEQHSSSSLIFGIISVSVAFLLGWIPFLGLLGVAAGIGLGIPAVIQAKRAKEAGFPQIAGLTCGWFGIGISVFWIAVYSFFMIVGSIADSTNGSYSSFM